MQPKKPSISRSRPALNAKSVSASSGQVGQVGQGSRTNAKSAPTAKLSSKSSTSDAVARVPDHIRQAIELRSKVGTAPMLTAKERKERKQIINQLLIKHNAVIHIEGSLSLVERKLYNVLLLNAYETLVSERTHTIPVHILCDLIGYHSHDTALLQASLGRIQSTRLEVNMLKDGRHKWESMTLLSYAKIEKGICTYRYDEAIAERLHQPEVYTRINLSVQNELGSAYSLALYENCVRFRDVGRTGAWEVELLRMMMGAHNDKTYKVFKSFNDLCLKRAVREINACSDIHIEPEFEREGRSIARIRFKVEKNKQNHLYTRSIDDPLAQLRQGSLYIKLRSMDLSDSLACLYIQHNHQRAKDALSYMESKLGSEPGRVRNKGAYIRALLESDCDLSSQDEKGRSKIESTVQNYIDETLRQREKVEQDTRAALAASMQFKAALQNISYQDFINLRQRFRDATGYALEYKRERSGSETGDEGSAGGGVFPFGEVPVSTFEGNTFMVWLRGAIHQVEQGAQSAPRLTEEAVAR